MCAGAHATLSQAPLCAAGAQIMTLPAVVLLEFAMLRKRQTSLQLAAVAVVCVGVGLATVADTQARARVLAVSALALGIMACVYPGVCFLLSALSFGQSAIKWCIRHSGPGQAPWQEYRRRRTKSRRAGEDQPAGDGRDRGRGPLHGRVPGEVGRSPGVVIQGFFANVPPVLAGLRVRQSVKAQSWKAQDAPGRSPLADLESLGRP